MLTALVMLVLLDSPGFPPALAADPAPVLVVEHKPKHWAATPPKAEAGPGECDCGSFCPCKVRATAETPPPSPIPAARPVAARWVTYAANPAYEIYGQEDAAGTFRYSTFRLKAGYQAAPAPRYYYGASNCASGQCGRR